MPRVDVSCTPTSPDARRDLRGWLALFCALVLGGLVWQGAAARTIRNFACRAISVFLAMVVLFSATATLSAWVTTATANATSGSAIDTCARPAPGSALPEPQDLRSHDGVLALDLTIRNVRAANGAIHYCYTLPDGAQAPTLRVYPGDLLVLHLKNALTSLPTSADANAPLDAGPMCSTKNKPSADPCLGGAMTPLATNLHFHGLTVPPVCHQDDVLKTSILPEDAPFEYSFRIPADEPPGLYWYHPHIHGFSASEVSGGASGALIVEGIERAVPEVAGLPERVFVIRDQELLNPNAPPSKFEPVVPKMMLGRDGNAANNGTGFGKPAFDLSVNYMTVPYPDYPTAQLAMKPGERQLWRVLNASAITYLNLSLLFGRAPQQLGIVAIDGVPIHRAGGNSVRAGSNAASVTWVDHIGVPPGARVEFIAIAPPEGVAGLLVTRAVDTGQGGANEPNRALVSISAKSEAMSLSTLPAHAEPLPPPSRPWIGDVAPVKVRKLYFSEKHENPDDPNSAMTFYITVEGQTPMPFDPASNVPNIVVTQGDVEDWIIENRSSELHTFHIHQGHFQLRDWLGRPVDEPFLRDTVNVPYYNGRALQYPSVRLRMDFRDPNSVGTFVYHCHLLQHEDGGMMGTIRVEPRNIGLRLDDAGTQSTGKGQVTNSTADSSMGTSGVARLLPPSTFKGSS
jgi:FtsP/CotA-like multicopper oxidase with cupredoxin domain